MGEDRAIISQGTNPYPYPDPYPYPNAHCTACEVEARSAIKHYQKIMPFVDQGDKNSAHFDIFSGRCKLRYHRVPFRWHLSFVGLNNTMVLFNMVCPLAPDLKKKYKNNALGYKVS